VIIFHDFKKILFKKSFPFRCFQRLSFIKLLDDAFDKTIDTPEVY